jgi:hypothetical protein
MFAFWIWPVWTEEDKGSCIVYIKVDSIPIVIIINIS